MSDIRKERAIVALNTAIGQGCKEARVTMNISRQSSYSVRDCNLDRLNQSTGSSLYIQLFIDGKYGSFSTNRTEPNQLKKFIQNAKEATLLLSADHARALPPPHLYYKGNDSDLDQFDSGIETLNPELKKELAFGCAREIYGSDSRIISVNSEYSDVDDYIYIVDSQGFEGESRQSSFSLSCDCSVKGDEDSRPEGWWYENSLFFNTLASKGIGNKTLERALSRLNPRKQKSGKYNMVLENTVSTRVIAPIISALNGASIQQNNSFLKDKIGKQVFSPSFQLFDTPHIKKAFGSRYFDGEGIATKPISIIENGVVQTYFINTYYSRKLGIPITTEGPSVPVCNHSDNIANANNHIDLDKILKYCNNGILVTGFNGGNSNTSTGDFSFGIQGFYFENGIVLHPIKEMNVTGNLITLWNSFIAAGTDPRNSGRWQIPTLAFENVNFSGI